MAGAATPRGTGPRRDRDKDPARGLGRSGPQSGGLAVAVTIPRLKYSARTAHRRHEGERSSLSKTTRGATDS